MSEQKHTPGPWGLCYDGGGTWSIGPEDDPQGNCVASVQGPHGLSAGDGFEVASANAHLIAAGPDYHEAMEHAKLDARELDGDNAGYVAITVEAWNMLWAAHAKVVNRS